MSPTIDLSLALDTARLAVHAGSKASLARFRSSELEIEWKPDRSPVTRADREAEAAILAVIRERFPEHGILAEETGAVAGDGISRWIVDPIDGTRGFSRGGTFWGPIVGLEHRGEIVAGAMALPALGETFWAARGMGSFRNGERVRLGEGRELQSATVSLGELRALLAPPHGAGVRRLIDEAAVTRCYGDVGGIAMLLLGRADAWLETGVKAWDVAGLEILVEEAGGRFTDFKGGNSILGGQALAAAPQLHATILAILAGAQT